MTGCSLGWAFRWCGSVSPSAGSAAATNDYHAWLNAGDQWYPNALDIFDGIWFAHRCSEGLKRGLLIRIAQSRILSSTARRNTMTCSLLNRIPASTRTTKTELYRGRGIRYPAVIREEFDSFQVSSTTAWPFWSSTSTGTLFLTVHHVWAAQLHSMSLNWTVWHVSSILCCGVWWWSYTAPWWNPSGMHRCCLYESVKKLSPNPEDFFLRTRIFAVSYSLELYLPNWLQKPWISSTFIFRKLRR